MNAEKIRVLLVEDSATDALIVEEELGHRADTPFSVVQVAQLSEALAQLETEHFDVVLLDLGLPDSCGFETFVRLHHAAPEVPIVVLSGQDDEELGIKSVQAGAQDYLVKGRMGEETLPRSIRYAIERQRAARTLSECQERYRLLIERSPDAYLVHSDGEIVFANAASLKLFGADHLDQLLGRSFLKTVSPEFHGLISKRVQNGQTNGSNPPIEVLGTRLDGRTVAVQGTSNPLIYEGKLAVQVVLHDVTEQKQAEGRLREQAKLLDLSQDAIMVRDMKDRVEFWNHGAENLYGWTAAEVQGKEASGFLYQDEPAFAAAARAVLIENGKWSGECKHTCKNRSTVRVRTRWTLVRDDFGLPKSVLIINTDITEQKRIEEQFLRAQRLESIGTLASGVAHDLNNILVPILMAAPLLREDMPAEEREKLLAIVQSSAERGASIVKQVLTFARGADGDRVLLQPIYLVQEIAKIAEETFPKSVAIRTNYPEDLWTIVADPTQLHQVLLNLCINSRDAMPTGGTLTLALENFEVDDHYVSMIPGAKAGPHVLLQVRDSGMGIPSDIIDKIFDPFFTTKELGQGTGLGLSTAIGIVKSHGGFMEVYSEVGRGTSFKVFLPANRNELVAGQTSEATPLPPAHGELLLIVDDEKPILQVAQALLESHGYRVLIAGDATEALAIFALRMNEIALVLTDLAMPFMDGVALIRTLKQMKPEVRVIASTGLAGQDARAIEIAHLNVRACLTKPYNKNKLLVTLHEVLNHVGGDNQ